MMHRRLKSPAEVDIHCGDFLEVSKRWPSPVAIVSDGAYGVGGFAGDPPTAAELVEWYRPFVRAWSDRARPDTTLWFWNTELGWATVHPLLLAHGWEYRNCHVWDKGIGHIAGNANSKTLRKFPVVTEVCVQYTRVVRLPCGDRLLTLKDWLRAEWERTGLPLYKTNEACGVRNAATRKYFTQCHMWYFPPPEAFGRLVAFANRFGHKCGRPYFSVDGRVSLSAENWSAMRAKFRCDHGITNVWGEPPVRGAERLKDTESKCVHTNQKPLRLLKRIIAASTDVGDCVWEPFGGLCSVAVACLQSARRCYSAEIRREFFDLAVKRLERTGANDPSLSFAASA